MPTLIDELGLEKDAKYLWRRTAGCFCGCSPGFVTDSQRLRGKTVYLRMKSVSMEIVKSVSK